MDRWTVVFVVLMAAMTAAQAANRRQAVTAPVTYTGREGDAPWRKTAAERIDRLRKGDMTIMVVDRDGKPVEGAAVAVHMKRHAFAFGSAVAAKALLDQSADGGKYRQIIGENFTRVVFENDLKWPHWPASKERMPEAMDWLRQRQIQIRGHCLVWPSWRWTPKDLVIFKDKPEALGRTVVDHITDIVSANRGKLVDWDVINEVYANHDLVDILGRQAMVDWFKAARAADPHVTLYINDYGILSGGGADEKHQDAYEKTIRYLKEQGAPIGGIGLQSHFGGRLTAPDRLMQVLDRFAALGLKLQATEFDIDITDEQAQADYTRDFLTLLFSHPAVDGILMWGFWEGRHWKPNAALWRRDWSIKSNGLAWLELVKKQWWTEASGTTDAQGRFRTRGFLGEYEIEVKAGGKKGLAKVRLGKEEVRLMVE